ncbi:MAG: aldehyde dehydrogenase family protein [Oceanospirillaceae bacterium]|jgi:aldehyde dehydrogenase (NAD+)|nr:aldehyde dehydrogenase family protein [Oceanospirillaceae bacterium]
MTLQHEFEKLNYSQALESDAEAQSWLTRHDRHFGHYVDGAFVSQDDAQLVDVTNPATSELLAQVEIANAQQIDQAVDAARRAQPSWWAMGGLGRAKVLYSFARGLQKHARLAAVLETLDNGKPIRESRDGDIPLAIRHFYHHAGWAKLQDQELASYAPVGVAAQIIPWNFPLLMLAWKIAPALAMGNTIVLKPAEQTPLTAMLFAHICEQAGVPAGVVNIINGAGVTGATLAAHKGVDKVAFTGSTSVGRGIREATAGQGKKLTLELGGKSAFIVFEDADLDAAVEGLVDSIWFNQGEVCCAGSRLLVQAPVANELHTKLKQRMQQLRSGMPLDKSIDVGSLVSQQQFDRVDQLVEQGLLAGGHAYQAQTKDPERNYYPPTLVTDVDTSHPLVQEEIFGPVLVSMTFRTQSEAVALANNSRYGLAASVWSENINRAMDVAPKIKAGVVWINNHNQFDAACGFGGVRESGFGREGGKEGLFEYLKPMGLTPVVTTQFKPTEEPFVANSIDRTLKFYIGGKQTRPDSGHSRACYNVDGSVAAIVGVGSRKDIRNAVSAAQKASPWSAQAGHARAQVMYFFAENLAQRHTEWVERLVRVCGYDVDTAEAEFEAAIGCLFSYAAWADKYDGAVHNAPYRGVTLALPEAVGSIALVAPDHQPLISSLALMAPTIAMGNRVVLVASEAYASIALELVQVLETSDIPAGVVNIVSGPKAELALHLAGHAEVEAMWCWADAATVAAVERTSAGNLKRLWTHSDNDRNWLDVEQSEGVEFLRQATQIKNIWTPYGD